MMDFNELVQRIRELDETLKLEMTERAKLAERVEELERLALPLIVISRGSGRDLDEVFRKVENNVFDTIHDREGEQDGTLKTNKGQSDKPSSGGS